MVHRPTHLSFHLRAVSIPFLVALLTGCGAVEVPISFEVTPGSSLSLNSATGPSIEVDVTGGVGLTMSFDPRELITPDGAVAVIEVDDVRVGNPEFSLLGFQTAVCMRNDPQAGGGTAQLQPLRQREAQWSLSLRLLVEFTNPLVAAFMPAPLSTYADFHEETSLRFADLLALALGRGSAAQLVLEQSAYPLLFLPPPVTTHLILVSTDEFPETPALETCDAFDL